MSTIPTFSWEPSRDPYLLDTLSYTLYISEDSTFSREVMIFENITDTEYPLTFENELVDNTLYFWKVKCTDRQGHEVWGSNSYVSPWKFIVGSLPGLLSSDVERIPGEFVFHPIYPNPFNNMAIIQYELPVQSSVELDVYNLRGQKIMTIFQGNQPPGTYSVLWNGRDENQRRVSSGIYIFYFKAGMQRFTQKALLLK
jgi:hypothetical protein